MSARQGNAAIEAPPRTSSWRHSLRAKATFAFAAVVAYALLAGGVLSMQRARLVDNVEDLERLNKVEATLARANTFVGQAIIKINDGYFAVDPTRVVESVRLDIESASAALGGLADWAPAARAMNRRLDAAFAEAYRSGSHGALVELRSAVRRLALDLDRLSREAQARHDGVWTTYRTHYDTVTLSAAAMFMLGLALFGGFAMVFFRRLVWDLRTLSERAVEVVRGYRGQWLPVTRHDEVGDLMDAVNRMQHILREREQLIEVSRQQRFHQEKMVAIGSLAAAVAHEINNPIAAIEGVAQRISDERTRRCASSVCQPLLILEHTRRIVGITRQLSQLTSRHSTDPEWTDLNALAHGTCTFITFDPRFRDVKLALRLDAGIPAIWAVPDHVTQVLMNLLINAADALSGRGGERRIDVSSAAADGMVRLVVADNAGGMGEAVARRAFDEGFTTKEHGSGIGLFMCKTLVERGRGQISLQSRVGVGTVITVSLPSHNAAEAVPSR